MAEELTAQQKLAVENRGGKLLVSAAAGSGKTKVLVDRLMMYLTDPGDPANLDDFLIITYTKAAASELRGKIAAKLTERIAQEPENRHLQKQLQRLYLTQISTVHSFCTNILREHAYRLDIPADFRVAEEAECRELQETVLQELLDQAYAQEGENEAFRAFADTQGLGRDDRQIPDLVIKVYNSARCHPNPEKWLEDCLKSFQIQGLMDAGETVWGKYLIDEMFDYLDCQIRVFRRCAADLDASERMEKPAQAFRNVLVQMEELRKCTTWDQIAQRKNISYETLTFPRKNIDTELADRARAVWADCKKMLPKKLVYFTDDSARVLTDLAQSAAAAEGLIWLVNGFIREYQRVKKSRRIMDFSDLEHKMLDLLLGTSRSGVTAAAEEIASRFREILVDEYQDSNQVQDAIFSALTGKRRNCFMVGDVKQSIYQFRLAEPQIFLDKYDSYDPAETAQPGAGRRILLSDNFRSGGEVIEAVNDVFRTCMSKRVGGLVYGDKEALREGRLHTPLGEPGVELHVLATAEESYSEEADFVAERIAEMLRQGTLVRDGDGLRPVTAGDIVILLRSTKNVAPEYQQALERRGIRCNAGQADLLKSEEIAVARALLQTVANPRQDIPLVSVLASPLFGFTADDLASFRRGRKNMSMFDALRQSEMQKAKDFLKTLAILRSTARMNTLSELVEQCYALTRMDSLYAAMPGGEIKNSNLQQFYQMASDYEKTGLRSLDQFLEHLDAAEEKGLKSDSGAAADSVTLMTVHSSKGLEFPVVFLCGLSRKFNTESSREQILCDKKLYLGLKTADTHSRIRYPSVSHRAIAARTAADGISEEMRVLYVAMTRAKDRLIMTYAARNPGNVLQSIARRSVLDEGALVCREASCPGTWVLLTALHHTEAGALHQAAETVMETQMGQFPWKITVTEPKPAETENKTTQQLRVLPLGAEEELRQELAFRYAHRAATMAPSKQTATGRKGRFRDAESAEEAPEPKAAVRSWRRPSFLSGEKDGKAYGSAMHCAMQYIRYENCGDADAVEREVRRMVADGFLTEEQGNMVNVSQIAAFFATEFGKKLAQGASCIREFKFSILDDASAYGDGLEGEQVLLQGVVDCALLEDDGITVLDFKTDRVSEDNVQTVAEKYRAQVETYCAALTRIYGKPVRSSWLYFFRLGKFISV